MSDPCLVQISFRVNDTMPEEMKKCLLISFTDYYGEHEISVEERNRLWDRYPHIRFLCRNDCYHNIEFQKYQLTKSDREQLNTNFKAATIGIGITSLPRSPEDLEDFLKSIGPYIGSTVCSIGYQHIYDFWEGACYYYMDSKGNIRKKLLIPSNDDEIVYKEQEHK